MSESFKDRIKRLHNAHRRGRDNENGPSGVYTADGQPDAESADGPTEVGGYGWQRLGAVKSTDYGPALWIATELCNGDDDHGVWTLRDCCQVHHRGLAQLDDDVSEQTRRTDLLYMDIETTGLSNDAIAFMLGLGYWNSDDRFVVEQLMIEEEEDEPALLRAFADRLENRRLLVTFNGVRFDAPVLQRRYSHHNIDDPLQGYPHLDLLPLSRRCFPGFSSYRLSKLEREVLSFERIDDVPGREIPRRWWKFQKTRDAELMRGVLEHNRHDIVSMEALVAAAIADEPPTRETSTGEPKWSFGRMGMKSLYNRDRSGGTPRQEEPGGDVEAGGDDAEAPPQDRPGSGIARRLERTYRLRGKFAERGGTKKSSGRGASEPTKSSEGVPSVGSPPAAGPADEPASGEVQRRADQLRAAARPLIDQQMWREAFPMLCELVALVPNDRWGLEMLARWYRQQGNEKLARRLEQRGD